MGMLYAPEPGHECYPPGGKCFRAKVDYRSYARDAEIGSVWQCDDCGTFWRVKQGCDDAWPRWRSISARRARRHLARAAVSLPTTGEDQ